MLQLVVHCVPKRDLKDVERAVEAAGDCGVPHVLAYPEFWIPASPVQIGLEPWL